MEFELGKRKSKEEVVERDTRTVGVRANDVKDRVE